MQQDAEPHQSSRKAAEVRACFTFVCFNDSARQNIPHSNEKATPVDAVQKTTSTVNAAARAFIGKTLAMWWCTAAHRHHAFYFII